MRTKTVLTVDLGAESGRVIAVHFDGIGFIFEELHRFPNSAMKIGQTLYWNFLSLWQNIQLGIEKGRAFNPASLGVDTWGVDFGLLDKHGSLIGNPVNYRDARTNGIPEKVFKKIPREVIFDQTGVQFMDINTLYQMASLVEADCPQLAIAETFLTVPDLLNYWLTGCKACEFSNATTTQMVNPRTKSWATGMLDKIGIPTHILPEIVPSGTPLGQYNGVPVIATACHDTASAVAAVPAQTENFAYISSGTWSLVGLELPEPIITPAALAANVTNEGGVYGTNRLLKNVMGLWILQQCRSQWAKEGDPLDYTILMRLAEKTPSQNAFFPVNDERLLPPGNHPKIIQELCRELGQPVPKSKGQIVRCVLESLALKYNDILQSLTALSGKAIDVVHIVGGGSRNQVLNQFTADVTGVPVESGPVEATALGNALIQFITLGEISNLAEGREIIRRSLYTNRYEPNPRSPLIG